MQGFHDQLDAELSQASKSLARASLVPGPDSGSRSCPTCGSLMGRLVFGQVIVDSCPAHGTWFDRGEVEQVTALCHKLRKRHQRDGD